VADTKVVFIAFAIEDERQRDFLKGPDYWAAAQACSTFARLLFISRRLEKAHG